MLEYFLSNQSFIIGYLSKLALVVLVLVLVNLLNKGVGSAIQRLANRNKPLSTFLSLLNDLLKYAIWVFTFPIILSILGFTQIALTVGGSIAIISLMLSHALANLIGDLLAGVFLLIEEDFQVGYQIRLDQIEGEVERLDIRKTKVRGKDGHLYIIPNRKVDSEVVVLISRGKRDPKIHPLKSKFHEKTL